MRVVVCILCTVLFTGCNITPPATPAGSKAGSVARSSGDIQPGLGGAREPGAESGRRRSRRARAAAGSQPGDFDFYLLSMSWSPEFCATHPSSPECSAHPGFVVHGLWPQNDDGSYPERCSTAAGPANPQQYTNLLPTVSLVEHEWVTHGTCSGLAPDAYFGEIGTAFHEIRIPAAFVNASQPMKVPPSAIVGQFQAANPSLPPGSIAISCGNNFLTAVEVCLSKTLQPEVCQNVHSCGATVVKVTPR